MKVKLSVKMTETETSSQLGVERKINRSID